MKTKGIVILILSMILTLGRLLPVDNNYMGESTSGIVVTVKKSFIDQYKNVILDKFLSQLKEVRFGSTHTIIDAKLVKIRAEVSNMQLNNAKLGLHSAHLQMYPGSPSMALKIDNIGLNFTFQYDLSTQPSVLSDTGIGSAYFDSLQLLLSCTPVIQKNKLQVLINDFNVNLEDMNLVIQGGDISSIVNNFIPYFKEYMKTYLKEQLNLVLKATLQGSVNALLQQSSASQIVGETDIIVNKLSQAEKVLVTEDFWAFEQDGTYYKDGGKLKFNNIPIKLPRYEADGKDMQVFLSEYSINSGLAVSSQSDILKTPLVPLKKDTIKQIIDRIEDAFTMEDTFYIQFKSHGNGPQVYLKPTGSQFSGEAVLEFRNPHSQKYNIAAVDLQIEGSIKFHLTSDFKLSGKVSNLKTRVQKFQPFFHTSTKVDDVKKHETLFAEWFEQSLNQQLSAGITLPVSTSITNYLKDGSVSERDQYLLIEGNAGVMKEDMQLQWSQEFVSSLIKMDTLKNVFSLNNNLLQIKISDKLRQFNLDENLINDIKALEEKLNNLKFDL